MTTVTKRRLSWRCLNRWWAALFAVIGWTPSMAGIVYTTLDDGYWALFYRADAAQAAVRIGAALPPGDRSAPRLSPDGAQVVFEITGGGVFQCPIPPAEGCETAPLLPASAVRPAWLPDGTGLVFTQFDTSASGEDSTISLIRQGMTQAEPLLTMTGVQDDPQVSPDGRWLLFTSGLTIGLQRAGVQVVQQLWVTDLQTGITRQALPGSARDMHGRWSPDGGHFAFASDRSGRFEIWVSDRNGETLRQVTAGPGSKTWPTWSPDGSELVFTYALNGRLALWRVGVDGRDMQPLAWFPPGSSRQVRDADWR
jgi:TolB protein